MDVQKLFIIRIGQRVKSSSHSLEFTCSLSPLGSTNCVSFGEPKVEEGET